MKKALKEITSDMGDFYDWAAKFRAMDSALFKYEIVEFSFFQMGLEPEISLTELTCQRLFSKDQVRFKDYFIPQHSQLITPEKIKIEIKSSAYLQSWEQTDYSKINFHLYLLI